MPNQYKKKQTDWCINWQNTYIHVTARTQEEYWKCRRHEKAVWTMCIHFLSTGEHPCHGLCPPSSESCYSYKKSQTMKGFRYSHKHSIPLAFVAAMKPVVRDPTRPQLLQKCIQNPNDEQCKQYSVVKNTKICICRL